MAANNYEKIVRKLLCAMKSFFAKVICKMHVMTCTKMPKQKVLLIEQCLVMLHDIVEGFS